MVRKKCKKLMNDQNFEEGNFMDFFGVLTMLGGLALFLYGMETMGKGLEKLSGGRLERILEKLTSNPIKAVLLGAGVTAIIQSSSATTVMVVGFVNSGIMKLTQAVGIIMGANIGTTVTSYPDSSNDQTIPTVHHTMGILPDLPESTDKDSV